MPNFAKLIDKARDAFIKKFPGLKLGTVKNRKALAALLIAFAAVLTVLLLRVVSASSEATKPVDAFGENVTISVPDAEDRDILGAENAIDAFETADGGGRNLAGRMAGEMFESLVPTLPETLGGGTPQGEGKDGGQSFRDRAMQSLADTSALTPADIEFRKQQQTLEEAKKKLENSRKALLEERERNDREHRERLIALGYDPDTGQPLSEERKAQLSQSSQSSSPAAQPETSSATAGETAQEEPATAVASIRRSGSVSTLDDSEWNTVGGVSSLDAESDLVNTANHPFEVMFTKNEKITSGGRVSVRILEDMMIEGVRIPENTQMSAICTIGSNRLEVKVQALKVNDKIYTLNLVGYDTDGLEGLYCPQSELNRGARQAKTEAGQIVRSALQSGIAGYAGQVVSAGASVIQSVSGNVTISVTAGYKFYLIKKEN